MKGEERQAPSGSVALLIDLIIDVKSPEDGQKAQLDVGKDLQKFQIINRAGRGRTTGDNAMTPKAFEGLRGCCIICKKSKISCYRKVL